MGSFPATEGLNPLAGMDCPVPDVIRFSGQKSEIQFGLQDGPAQKPRGPAHPMVFAPDRFTGCRLELFLFTAEGAGGSASFRRFTYGASGGV